MHPFLQQLLAGQAVEWKPLGKVFDVLAGGDVPKDSLSETRTDEFNVPILSNGIESKSLYGWTNQAKVHKPSLTISARGTIGWTSIQIKPFFPIVRLLVLTPKIDVNLKYLYYYMKNIENNYKVNESGIPQLTKPMIKDISIPIPPLSVQAKIAQILDAFTAITAELTAELDMRNKQYQYYRDKLLSENELAKVGFEWKTLDQFSENLNPLRKPIKGGLREQGDIPYYGASGIVDYVKDYIFDDDLLLISEDGANLLARNTPIAFSVSGKCWVNNHAHVLKFKTYAERRFVEFYLNNMDLTPYISGAAQPKLNKQNLNSIKIPIPPPAEQARIVAILDKFDTLTQSIKDGLPREIELRQQQYAYYREMLLGFET